MEKLPNRDVLKSMVALVKAYRYAQAQRIRFNNRLKARDSGRASDDALSAAADARMLALWRDTESRVEAQIDTLVSLETSDLFQAVLGLRGIGPTLAAQLLGPIVIEKARTVSALWRYCGMGVGKHGRPDGMVKGRALVYNIDSRRACMLIADSLLRNRSPYSAVYYESRALYDRTHPEWTPMHAHMAAKRRMVKRFLGHLWLTWRTLAGLPVTRPYGDVADRPADYGWPDLESEYVYDGD